MKILQRKKVLLIFICLLVMLSTLILPKYQIYALNNFEAPSYFNENTINTDQIKVANIINNCSIYSSKNIDSNEHTIVKDSKILILEDNILEHEDISYVLYEENSTLIFGYITKSKYELLNFESNKRSLTTFYNNVKVYKYPTKSSPIINTINEITTFETLNNCADYTDGNNNKFYAVNYQTGICYISIDDLTSTNIFEPKKTNNKSNIDDNLVQMTAYFVIIICLFIATIFISVKILKKRDK